MTRRGPWSTKEAAQHRADLLEAMKNPIAEAQRMRVGDDARDAGKE
jgi:hypothetical protein